jgi:putative mRNA 3-end processing factor
VLGDFFQCDPDLRICGTEVYLDPQEPRQLGIISHGHADHIGRHQQFVATKATAAFLRLRQGRDLRGTELAFRQPHQIGSLQVELYPAGHIFGSAMIRVSDGSRSLLYTGDFRLAPSLTAEPAEVPESDVVIMESTYGAPEWKFPSREQLGAELLELVGDLLRRGSTPVLLAYSLGKAQETLAMLRGSGHDVVVHPVVAAINEIYEREGVDLGTWSLWSRQQMLMGRRTVGDPRNRVVILPPHMQREMRKIAGAVPVHLTGWCLRRKMGGFALPLSDHADFDELLEFVDRAKAKVVYVTHGSARFASELRSRGHRAEFLRPKPQMRLF